MAVNFISNTDLKITGTDKSTKSGRPVIFVNEKQNDYCRDATNLTPVW